MTDNDNCIKQEPNRSEQPAYPPVSIIIPAYNEEGAIAPQIEAIKTALIKKLYSNNSIL